MCGTTVTGFLLRAGLAVAALIVHLRVVATPISPEEAGRVAAGWLARTPAPLEVALNQRITDAARPRLDAAGQTLYYLISLRPEGFVITSADTEVEPIIAFSSTGRFDPDPRQPLAGLLERDLGSRLAQVRRTPPQPSSTLGAPAKWVHLLQRPATLQSGDGPRVTLDDLRIAPLVQSRWSQTTIWDGSAYVACYNYYTPPYAAGASSNYPSGCTATAWGQVLRYFKYPAQGVGTAAFNIQVDGLFQTLPPRGGDGQGGPYPWDQMTYLPGRGTTEQERQAIGALLIDVGVASGTQYTAADAKATLAVSPLTRVFRYGNVNADQGLTERFAAEVNASLDARLPCVLILSGGAYRHMVVCDGYGFNQSTVYYHLNLGWAGMSDAWYNLPVVGTPYGFNAIETCYFNIYTNGTGEIVSGRVTDAQNRPITNATVVATANGATHSVVTDERGIYALTHLPAATAFTLVASSTGYRFVPRSLATGRSQDNLEVGNRWGLDFVSLPNPEVCPVWGVIRGGDGAGLADVVVQFSNGGGQVRSQASGLFVQLVPVGWSGTITPSAAGLGFVPGMWTVSKVFAGAGNLNFVGGDIVVSGKVIHPDGSGMAGVKIEFGNGAGETTTDSSGGFQRAVPLDWSGTLTPSFATFTFLPAARSCSNLLRNVTDADFLAQAVAVAGTVTAPDGVGLSGVDLQFSNQGGQATTDSQGRFVNWVPQGWSGTLTPSKPASTFSPALVTLANVATDLRGQDFVGVTLLRVDSRARGLNNGVSWADALTNLQSALAQATYGTELWVAQGVYFPGTNRSDSFQCAAGVSVYGGFRGAETNRAQRDWNRHLTVLSGEIGAPSENRDNSFHVVRGTGGARVDGFLITGGNANGTADDANGAGVRGSKLSGGGRPFVLANCAVFNNFAAGNGGGCYEGDLLNCVVSNNVALLGGGLYSGSARGCLILGNTTAAGIGGGACLSSLNNCRLSGNSAAHGGGAWQCTLTNCLLNDNHAGDGGGATWSILVNCTVADNSAVYYAGGLSGGSALNSIVHNNSVAPRGIYPNFYSTTFAYSCTLPDPGGDHNITNAPAFVSAWDYRLTPGTACINRGTNQPWMATALDLAGQPRLRGGTVDLGAYEAANPGPRLELVCSKGLAQVRWLTSPRATYFLEYTDSLAQPTWQPLGQVVGNGSPQAMNDPTAVGQQRFYRVRLED